MIAEQSVDAKTRYWGGSPEALMQHRNFVPAQRDIRLRVVLNTGQANEVVKLLLAAFPDLATLRSAGQLQLVNSGGQLRIAAVRGGTLPEALTVADVQTLVETVQEAMPAEPAGEPTWYTNVRAHYARRGGR